MRRRPSRDNRCCDSTYFEHCRVKNATAAYQQEVALEAKFADAKAAHAQVVYIAAQFEKIAQELEVNL